MKEDSPLRAIAGATQEFMSQSEASQSQLTLSSRIFATTLQVVESLGRVLSARTGGSVGSDVDWVADERTVPQRALDTARGVLRATVDRIPVGKAVGDAFLAEIARDFASHDETGNPAWNSSDVLRRMEQAVLEHATKESIPIDEAVEHFREAVAGAEDMHPGLRAKLFAGLAGIDGMALLQQTIQDSGTFKGVSPQDSWRLFATGQRQDDGVDKWELEHRGEGSFGAMQRAFTLMLSTHQDGLRLTPDLVEQFHREGSEGTYLSGMLSLSYKQGMSEEEQSEYRELGRTPPGFRSRETNLTLHLDTETTPAGRQELLALRETDPWFAAMNNGEIPGEFGISYASKTPEETKARTRDILTRYEMDIQGAESEDDKLAVIGRAVQDLYRSHVFEDGNTRTTVFTVMNRMLLDNGLSPAILHEPKAAAGFSGPEFVQHIREGQERFQGLRT
jgi:hypothetical protein